MKIDIEITHEDLIKADALNIQALFNVVQSFAKTFKVGDEYAMRKAVYEEYDKRHKTKENKPAEKQTEKTADEKTFDRTAIEIEIKKIAEGGKDKGASRKIKETLQSLGYEKVSDVPDEKMTEFLLKVQEATR